MIEQVASGTAEDISEYEAWHYNTLNEEILGSI
jgi:hypothetical protein